MPFTRNPHGSDFFISFNSADRGWAEWIASELEAAQYKVIYQSWDFQPGSNFVLEMQKATTQSQRTIIVLSPAFLSAAFPQPEWAAAFAQDPTGAKRTLVPIRIQPCKPEGLLAQIVYADLVGLNEADARKALLAAVNPVRPAPGSIPFPATQPAQPVPEKKPFPGALPARCNLLGARNPHYLDRDGLLARLAESLTKGHTAALTQTLAGLGGVGKSTLAREYAHAYAASYDTIWWVAAEQEATLITDLAHLARAAQVADADTKDIDAAPAAIRWLRGEARWLLIFDNAVDPAALAPWLPGAGHVVITSRNPHWRGLGETLPLAVFTPAQSADFLADRTGITTEREAALALAEALGGLPAALELAASYIEQNVITLAGYLALLQKHAVKLLEPVAQAFQVSVKKLSPASLLLLRQLSCLAPDDVPRSLLMEDELAFNAALSALVRYSLVDVKGDGLFTHRLVQSAVRGGDGVLADVVETLNAAFPYSQQDLATWPLSGRLFPHVLALEAHTQALPSPPESLGRLLNQAGLYALNVRSDLTAALRLLRRALAIAEQVYGPHHPTVAIRANNIGMILQDQGDLAGALIYAQRALAILQQTLGPDHPNTRTAAKNLASIQAALVTPG